MTAEAFNLADNYHCPVLIASDLAIALFQQTVEPDAIALDKLPAVDRGPLGNPEEMAALGRDIFERYSKNVNAQGVSARSLPGMPNGQFLATGAEHGPFGKVTESASNRVYMMERRMHRIRNVKTEAVRYFGSENADIVLVAFGTTLGAAKEAIAQIETATGKKVGVIQVRLIYPVPAKQIQALAKGAKALVIESNGTAQFSFMLRGAGYNPADLTSLLKYDGNLLTGEEIRNAAMAVLNGEGQFFVTGGGKGVRPTTDPTITLTAQEA